MKAKLIGHTQPVKYAVDELEHGLKNIEDMIAYCAKVSNPQGQMNLASSEKLLNYLVKHKHWSPFEMASATIEVETTRDIARQFLRHRSFSFQEFSQRYADPEAMENTFVIREARLQDPSNRQNSIDCDDEELKKAWRIKQQMIIHETKIAYKWAVDNGIAKEQARAVLPEGNTVSRLYANGTIRSWIHYVELRSGHGTQKEHMELAREIGMAVSRIFPMITQYINK
jgi:thymidylate synthase (FAD)|tara:strand:- start:441 stop:1121 length:681 start_codon:yes stop_codon:yes gene_type:complete